MKPAAKFLSEAKALFREGRLTSARNKMTDALSFYPRNKKIVEYLSYIEEVIYYGLDAVEANRKRQRKVKI